MYAVRTRLISKVIIQSTPFDVQRFIEINFAAKGDAGCFYLRYHTCATSPAGSTYSVYYH